MSKGGRFHGRAEREREGSPLAEILRPRAIICPAGLFRLLARGWSPYLHTRPIYSIRRLPYQRFSIPVYIVFHRVRAHTRAQSYQLHARGASRGGAKLTRRRRKKRRRLGERKEREKKGKKANIKMCKWRHDILEKRSILTKSIHERESSHTVSMVFSFAGGGPRPPRFFRNLSSTRPSTPPLLLSRFLPYPRFFNSHAWARMGREGPIPVLVRRARSLSLVNSARQRSSKSTRF